MPSKDSDNLNDSDITDKYMPVSASGVRLRWADSNDARLPGLLNQVTKFWKRRGYFKQYFTNRAVPVGSKLAIDSRNAYQFVSGTIKDERGYDDRCPPTGKRIRDLPTHSPFADKFKAIGDDVAIPGHIIVAPHLVDEEDARLLKSLEYVIEGSFHAPKLLDDAEG